MAAPTFLIVRSEDFVVLAVDWAGFEVRTGTGPGTPQLVATGPHPTVTLTFPPQAVLEQTTPAAFNTAGFVQSDSRLSGPSQLVFDVTSGTVIELSAQGILEALTAHTHAHVDDQTSAIELPWGLTVRPVARSSTASVVSHHAERPVTSEHSGAVAMWRARLQASDATATDAFLLVRPTSFSESDIHPQDPFGSPPLTHWRDLIVSSSAQHSLPVATRLELSALGGSLSAAAKWPSVSWTHLMALGRDDQVDVTATGKLWPFGIPVVYQEFTKRNFLPVHSPTSLGCVAALLKHRVLVVTVPLVSGVRTSTFPFDEVEILGREFSLSNTPEPANPRMFLPGGASSPVEFPIRCRSGTTDVQFRIPLIFVADTETGPAPAILNDWRPHASVQVPGVELDMVGAEGKPGDVHEVHSLTFSGKDDGTGHHPDLATFDVVLSALRSLLPGPEHAQPQTLRYAAEMRSLSDAADGFLRTSVPAVPLIFDTPNGVPVNFTKSADRSGGLVAPKFSADGISRDLGPVATSVLPDKPNLSAALNRAFSGATLFGFPLSALIDTTGDPKPSPPKIVQRKEGTDTRVEMRWEGLRLKAHSAFQPRTAGQSPQLDLFIGCGPTASGAATPAAVAPPPTCALKNFALVLPPPPATTRLLRLSFESVAFTQSPGRPASLDLNGLKIEFEGALKLLGQLQKKLESFLGGRGFTSKVSTSGITVGYEFGIPKTAAGAFVLQNIAVRVAVTVPFAEEPVTVALGFASREHPFSVSVSAFGGGGYAVVEIAGANEPRVEICLEFGAMLAVDFVVASAEVHALGGVRFVRLANGAVELEAFIRIGGSVRLLGLVTVSIELRVALTYQEGPPRLLGRASLVVELDLTLYAESVTIDSGTFELVGGTAPRRTAADRKATGKRSVAAVETWQQYRRAFAP